MTTIDERPEQRPSFGRYFFLRKTICAMLLCALCSCPIVADDAEIGKLLKTRGATVTEAKGVVTAITIQDGSKLSGEDFRQIPRLAFLKTLSLSDGIDDERLSQLTVLAKLEYLQTNLAQVTDDGTKPIARLTNLKNLKFFHPGKAFTGAGLAHLAEMPNLERLTVAGSLAFNDDGMAAVARLTRLKEFRTWHAGGTDEGVKKLKALKELKSLNLGQRLTYKLPACPTDATISHLTELKGLESIQLSEARLTFAALKQLNQLPELKKLTLEGIDISKDELERLKTELPLVKIDWTEPSEVYQKRVRALFGSR